jgi:uncharacterized membrane protein
VIFELLTYFSAWATDPIGKSHVLTAIIALIAGVVLFRSYKGTIRHKWVGYIYVISMLVMNVTALSHYTLTGGFNMFHAFAIFSTATIVPATWLILAAKKTGKKAYYMGHGITMSWSYFGLFAALVSESATRQFPHIFLSGDSFWTSFMIFLFFYLSISAWWTKRMIDKNIPRIFENY